MAWVTLNEGLYWPRPEPAILGSQSLALSATTTRRACIFTSAKSGLLTGVRFTFGTVTTPQDLTIALQDVDASWFPDGVDDQSTTYTPVGGDANTVKSVTFGSPRSVSKGDQLAVVIRWTSTTGSINIAGPGSASSLDGSSQGIGRAYTSGAWGDATTVALSLDWQDGEHSFNPGIFVVPGTRTSINADISLTASSSPDEVGNRIVAPVNGVISGFFTPIWLANVATCTAYLYDSQSSVVFSRALIAQSGGSSFPKLVHVERLPTPIAVSRGDVFRVAIQATNATAQAITRHVVDTNARLAAAHGGADINCYRTERTDAGAWTDTNNERLPQFGIIYCCIDDGTGPASTTWMPQGKAVGEEPPLILPA